MLIWSWLLYYHKLFSRWNSEGDEIRHAWYQWVCFVLFIQAVLCYLPHYIWKLCEGGKLSMLMQGMNGAMLDTGSEKFETERKKFIDYFLRTFHTHSSYVYKFVFCEVLNLVNVLFQVHNDSRNFEHPCFPDLVINFLNNIWWNLEFFGR